MSKEEIMEMIVNWPPMTETQMNFETVCDFVFERVNEADMFRFHDVDSILKWLHSDETISNQYHPVTQFRPQHSSREEPTLVKMLRPGTKIIIPKPRPNDKRFTNIESAQAYLNQNVIYQTIDVDVDYDDSDEVDVISCDYSPPWNQFHMLEDPTPKPRKNARMHRVLMEKQPTATYTCNARTIIQPKKKTIKATNVDACDEPLFECQSCDRKYKRKSSLNRHEKIHLAKSDDNTTIQNIPTKQATIIIPLNAAELIST